MNFVRANIKWIMLVSGALTFTMVYAAIAPQEALRSFFGETIEGPLAEIIVRNWGALVALVGALLIYGAFYPPVRSVVLVVAGISKLTFIGLVIVLGTPFLDQQVGIAIAVDTVWVALFIWYFMSSATSA